MYRLNITNLQCDGNPAAMNFTLSPTLSLRSLCFIIVTVHV